MSVKSKVKRCNKEIERLNKELQKLKTELCNKSVQSSSKEQLYENIIKFAITNQVGRLRAGMMIDYDSVDKMNDLRLDIERKHFEHSYIMRVNYKY